MKLTDNDFIHVIDSTPLVAIDLVIRNERNEVLLGKRKNRPAKDTWFVPGGRIKKNEKLQDALQRICFAELKISPPMGKLLGVFDHIYDDNYFGVDGVNTHYVTLGYQFTLDSQVRIDHDDQHAELKWWSIADLRLSQDVHQNTKNYFSRQDGSSFACDCEI
jgi:colanic acid biosynthesis protein WcaH